MALTFTYSGNVYGTGSAGQTTFPLVSTAGNDIPYLLPAHIHAYFSTDGQQTWNELTRPGEWDFNNAGTAVVLAAPLPAATELLIRRITPPLDPFVNFQPSSLLTAEQLNEAERFSLYLDQELKDSVDIESAGALLYQGLIDLTADDAPISPRAGWLYYNTGAGTVGQGGTPGWVGIVGVTVAGGERVIYDGTNWTLPVARFGVQQVTGTSPIAVDNTDPQRPIVGIPEATTSAAGAMSSADKTKLDGIASGAEVNVQSDWNEANTGSDAFIQNKPDLTPGSGDFGFWNRTGTVVAPATATDDINTLGDIAAGGALGGASLNVNGLEYASVDGTAGQLLTTDGAGTLGWSTVDPPPGTVISDTPPLNPEEGQLWWDSVGGQLYVWYVDANSSQWVSAAGGGVSALPPQLLVSSAGPTPSVTIDSSGRLGVGTATPATTFVVEKSDASGLSSHVLVNNSESSSGVSLLGAGSSFSSAGWPAQTDCGIVRSSAGSANGLAIQAPNGPISFWNSSAEAARIDSAGRLLVGTTSSTAVAGYGEPLLQLSGDYTRSGAFINASAGNESCGFIIGKNTAGISANWTLGAVEFQGSDGTGLKQSALIRAKADGGFAAGSTPGRLEFSTAPSGSTTPVTRATIDAAGRLLAGTASSSSNVRMVLQGHSGGATEPAILQLQRDKDVFNNDDLGALFFGHSSGNVGAQIRAAGDGAWSTNNQPTRLSFWTCPGGSASPVERMRVRSDGQINTTGRVSINNSGSHGFTALAVDGDSTSNYIAYIKDTRTDNAAGAATLEFRRVNGAVGSISTTTSSTSYNTSSDYRLKENVTAVTDGIARLQQLKPCRFNFIADPKTTVDGFLAHEAQEVIPECVTGQKDAVDSDGNPVYQAIDQSKLVPLLTAALQEALGRIEQLETTNASLEARLTKLEGGN